MLRSRGRARTQDLQPWDGAFEAQWCRNRNFKPRHYQSRLSVFLASDRPNVGGDRVAVSRRQLAVSQCGRTRAEPPSANARAKSRIDSLPKATQKPVFAPTWLPTLLLAPFDVSEFRTGTSGQRPHLSERPIGLRFDQRMKAARRELFKAHEKCYECNRFVAQLVEGK
jgi:hypothetical protein